MKISIIGSGLMGPAAAYNAMADPAVTQVMMCDVSEAQLAVSAAVLQGKPGADILHFIPLDLRDQAATVAHMGHYDVIIAALPKTVHTLAIRAALKAGKPLVDLSQVPEDIKAELRAEAAPNNLIVLGSGVEPGLTEVMARYLAEQMDRVDELHIKCGGIPANPQPPLNYKIVFGGRLMPVREQDSEVVVAGKIQMVPRYSGVEAVTFPGVGDCEAWHEGFKPWILDIPALQHIHTGTQKTVRWPGYAAQITVLKELGLLSKKPVLVDGMEVIPKHLVDAVLYPQVKLDEGEHDITCFRVELVGEKDGRSCIYQAEMVDKYDVTTGFTSMARTTAMTGAIVARMIANGTVTATGAPITTPEQLITGQQVEQLLAELAAAGMEMMITQRFI